MPSRAMNEKVPHWYPKEIPVVSLIGQTGCGQAIREAEKGRRRENREKAARRENRKERNNEAYASAPAHTAPTPRHHVSCLRPPARPQAAGPANLATTHGSDSAANQETRSPAARALRLRATSMRPRESEGAAAGGDDDDDGAVRSERSGPQSWALGPQAPAPASGLRSQLATSQEAIT